MAKLILKHGIFYSDLTINGRRVRDPLSIYRPIAQGKLDDMKALARAQRKGFVPEDLSWDLFKAKFLDYSIDKHPDSLYFVHAMFKAVDTHLSIRALREMTPERLADLKAKMIKCGVAPSMITRLVREVKTAMRYAEDLGYIKMQNWRLVKVTEPAGRLDFYEMVAYEALLQKLKDMGSPWFTSAYLMGHAGLRLSESYFLEWPDIQFEHRRIYLRSKPHLKWRLKSDKKGNKFRTIPLTLDYGLEAHLKSICKPQGFVLGDIRPSSPDWYGSQVAEALKATGVETHLGGLGSAHVLRHTFGSHLAQSGVSLPQIRDWMGHTTTRMTEVYSHLMPGNPDNFRFKSSVDFLSTFQATKVILGEQQQNNAQLGVSENTTKTDDFDQ